MRACDTDVGGDRHALGEERASTNMGSARDISTSAIGDRHRAVDHDAGRDANRGARSGLDVAGLVLRVRRACDLSQRELAAQVGRDQSQIVRLEASRSIPGLELLERILGQAGLHLAVVDGDGVEVRSVDADSIRDGAGRRMPAHLDVRTLADRPRSAWLSAHRDDVRRTAWYHLRAERDRRRSAVGGDIDDQPTQRERELAARVRPAAQARPADRVPAERAMQLEQTCECPDLCWGSLACVDECTCRCGG
jgi:transcriptional regulator with XRE-family HTH domain